MSDEQRHVEVLHDQARASIDEAAGGPEQPEAPGLSAAQIKESAHGTVWYCVGTGDYNVLRLTLLQQDPETLRDWDEQAARLRDEIRRALIWHASVS